MQTFDPSNVPEITKAFFTEQMMSAPPGMKPHTLYLGRRQLKELNAIQANPSLPDLSTADAPFRFCQVTVVPVCAREHYMLTFVEIPSKIQRLKELLVYCLHLPVGANFPQENLEVRALAQATQEAFAEELQ
jgi:hypothetical protein